jgi:D-amino-acid oxidase
MVVGCGVIGLTTGLILLRDGHEVTLLAKDTPPATTSNAAGAFWNPVFHEPLSSLRNQLALATHNYIHTHILHKHNEAACVERMVDTYYTAELSAPHLEVCHSNYIY